ncbi:hypothetical protein RPMA_09540 [Tardiphaga alba]|uniref:AbiV family abortive infection protein n=1 Tax=Tardiphaga alba TaxID=340268 RepID=A0ABX8A6I9_9BRAD|nr:hypothetical protein [Tardiphaga alba]QUS39047.1 hypothetical protein RPMA_09540 [Tardiphaga alba]
MNRDKFIAEAPYYYALGMAWCFWKLGHQGFVDALAVAENLGEAQGKKFLDPKSPLFAVAANILVESSLLQVVDDPFAPTVFRARKEAGVWLKNDSPKVHPLFEKFNLGLNDIWLRQALWSVNSYAVENNITDFDLLAFAPGSTNIDVPEPIPIDRDTEEYKAMESAIDEAIEKIEADNVFAISAPAERKIALDGLKSFRETISTEAQISWMYVKTFALTPLSEAAKKAGDGALNLVLQGAKSAVLEWIKKNAGDMLKGILGG